MIPLDQHSLWKTRQVAEALGLSVSTVKRLVDSGEIRAARTSGKHRLISPLEALRYARERDLPAEGLERFLGLAEPAHVPEAELDDEARDALASALRRGRAEEARDRIISTFQNTRNAASLADHLIHPAMEKIGHDWKNGSLDVFQEHRATRIIESALFELLNRVQASSPRHSTAPLALGASPEGDLYTLPSLLCELVLRAEGWDVMNLGPNLPMCSLAKAVLAHQPRLVWISVSHLADPDQFVSDYAAFHASASKTSAAVFMGGKALSPDLRARIVSAGFGERMAHLREFATRLRPPSTVLGRRASGAALDPTDSSSDNA